MMLGCWIAGISTTAPADRDSYENPNKDLKDQYSSSKPAFFGIDKNGNPRTKSRDEKN